MKAGANRTDIASITQMAKAGDDAEFISRALQVEVKVVKSFMPKKDTSKSKAKLADKKAE